VDPIMLGLAIILLVILVVCCVREAAKWVGWRFLTFERTFESVGSAVAFLVMWPFVMGILIISSHMIGRGLLNLYKHR